MTGHSFDAWHLSPAAEPHVGTFRTVDPGPAGIPVRAPEITDGLIAGVATGLREAQRRLADRPWTEVAASVGAVAERLLDTGDSLRDQALASLESTTPLSAASAVAVLDGMARDWRASRLRRMVEVEGLTEALDRLAPGPSGTLLRARGRPLTLHVGAGTVPGVAVASLIRALIVKSAAWVKPGLGDVALPVIFARALGERDPDLAEAVAVTYWPGPEIPRSLLGAMDLLVVYGGNDTVRDLRASVAATTEIVVYHHRLSFGVVAREAMSDPGLPYQVARAAAVFDQRGCVSPHIVFVERGGPVTPEAWAGRLSEACEAVADDLPPGRWSAAEASAVQQLRGTAELRAAQDDSVRVTGGEGLAWTVVLDPDAGPSMPCLARSLTVRPVDDVAEVEGLMAPVADLLQSVGWAGPSSRGVALAERLSAIGVTRLCPFDAQPFPPAWWRHDGKPPLAPLVRWTEVDL